MDEIINKTGGCEISSRTSEDGGALVKSRHVEGVQTRQREDSTLENIGVRIDSLSEKACESQIDMETLNPKEFRLIAIYGRVSTSLQENEGTVETQLSALRDHAKRNSLTIVKEYTDNGWSGDILARPALDDLRQDAKRKMWEAVLIVAPDRLARRYSYQELVTDELREAGVEVMFMTVAAPRDAGEKILHGVHGLFAEYERAKIAERFRLGKLRKIKEGHILVSEALYGYRYIPLVKKQGGAKQHGYYEIYPDEARVVEMIFRWIVEDGMTLRSVVRKLHELGIRPRKSKRGVWSTSTLSKMLQNKTYIGEAHWGSTYAVVPENPINKSRYRKLKKSSRKLRPEDEWHTIPVTPIIDRELFDRARQRIAANFEQCVRNRKNDYLLAGKIACVCGRRRTGEGPQHGKHLYYRCSDRVCSFPLPPTCKEKGLNARIADKLVWQKIAKLMGSPDLMARQVDRWMRERNEDAQIGTTDVRALTKEISKIREQEDRYNKAYGTGVFSLETLKEYTAPLRERLAGIEVQIQAVNSQKQHLSVGSVPTRAEIDAFSQEAQKMLHNLSFGAKRAIVMNAVDRIVGTPRELQVFGHLPLTRHVEFKTSHRNRRSTERGEIHTF